MSLEKLLYRFLLDSPGALLKSGESIGIGVLGMGDMGGDVDIGDRDDWHDDDDEGKNEEEELVDQGERGVEEQVDMESSLGLLLHWMVSLTGGSLLLLLLPLSMLSNDWQHCCGQTQLCVGAARADPQLSGPGQPRAASQAGRQ